MGLAIGNLVLFSVLLTLQWATLTNKMYRRLEESRKQHEDDNNLLEGLYAEDEGRKIQAYQERAEKDASFLHDVVDFSLQVTPVPNTRCLARASDINQPVYEP